MAHGCGLSCGTRREFLTRIPGAVLAAIVAGDAAAAEVSYAITEMAGEAAGPSQTSYPIPAADGVTIDKKTQVILVRYQGKLIAFNLACPHENTALRWKADAGRFQCPKHDSKYTPEGTFTAGRATRNMDRLTIKRDGANVIVDLSKIIKSDAQPAEWAAAQITI